METEDADLSEDTSRINSHDINNMKPLIDELLNENQEMKDELEEEINST